MMSEPDWKALRLDGLKTVGEALVPPNIKLPMLPTAVIEFSQCAADPGSTPKQLGKIIESDAGLMCDLLRHMNSAATGLRSTVRSAQHAISLLGIQRVSRFVATTAIKSAMQSRDSKLVNIRVFWNTNLERALFASEIAGLLGADAELAYAGAMLQDFLLPILSSERLDDYVSFSAGRTEGHAELSAFESSFFGWDHARAAAQVIGDWGFPDDLVCCVMFHHRGLKVLSDASIGRSSAAAVALASLMPDFLKQVPEGLEQLKQLTNAWKSFDLLEVAKNVDARFREVAGNNANQHISLLRRCEKALAAAEVA